MTSQEIKEAGSTFLNQRLAVVEYSTIRAQAAEAETIRNELADRRLAYIKASKSREACRIAFANRTR